jgi:hypothetical protein
LANQQNVEDIFILFASFCFSLNVRLSKKAIKIQASHLLEMRKEKIVVVVDEELKFVTRISYLLSFKVRFLME